MIGRIEVSAEEIGCELGGAFYIQREEVSTTLPEARLMLVLPETLLPSTQPVDHLGLTDR